MARQQLCVVRIVRGTARVSGSDVADDNVQIPSDQFGQSIIPQLMCSKP